MTSTTGGGSMRIVDPQLPSLARAARHSQPEI
jgi:hypothetical protein